MAVLILIVEDEPVQAEAMAELLESNGYSVCGVVSTNDDAVRVALAERPQVIIVDLRLIGPKDGVDLAASLRAVYDFGLIFVTGNTYPTAGIQRMRTQKPDAIIAKPVDGQVLLNAVLRASRPGDSRTPS